MIKRIKNFQILAITKEPYKINLSEICKIFLLHLPPVLVKSFVLAFFQVVFLYLAIVIQKSHWNFHHGQIILKIDLLTHPKTLYLSLVGAFLFGIYFKVFETIQLIVHSFIPLTCAFNFKTPHYSLIEKFNFIFAF